MIWGLTLNPGELHTEVVGSEVHLSMAALESRADLGTEYNGYTQVMLRTETSEHLLCTLVHGILFQQNLDLRLREGERISVFIQGKNKVHLTGYSGWSLPERDTNPAHNINQEPRTVQPPLPENHLDPQPAVFSPLPALPRVKMEYPDDDFLEKWSRQSLIASRHEAEVNEALFFHERLRQKLGENLPKQAYHPKRRETMHQRRSSRGPPETVLEDNLEPHTPAAEDLRANGPHCTPPHVPLSPTGTTVNLINEETPCRIEERAIERQIKRVRNRRRKKERLRTLELPSVPVPSREDIIHNDTAPASDEDPASISKERSHTPTKTSADPSKSCSNSIDSPYVGSIKTESEPLTELPLQDDRAEDDCSSPSSNPYASSHQSNSSYQDKQESKVMPPYVLTSLPIPTTPSFLWNHQSVPLSDVVGGMNGQKAFGCQYCGKLFSQASNLRTHQLIHSDNKPYKCKFCGVGFKQAGNLKAHERIHTGIKPFKCQFCPKQFSRSTTRRVHERLHTGQTPFKCKYCSKRFYQSSNLKNHERSHEGLPPEGLHPERNGPD